MQKNLQMPPTLYITFAFGDYNRNFNHVLWMEKLACDYRQHITGTFLFHVSDAMDPSISSSQNCQNFKVKWGIHQPRPFCSLWERCCKQRMRNKRLEENKMRHRNEKWNLFMRTATSGWALSEIDKERWRSRSCRRNMAHYRHVELKLSALVLRSGCPPAYGNADSCRAARRKEKTK